MTRRSTRRVSEVPPATSSSSARRSAKAICLLRERRTTVDRRERGSERVARSPVVAERHRGCGRPPHGVPSHRPAPTPRRRAVRPRRRRRSLRRRVRRPGTGAGRSPVHVHDRRRRAPRAAASISVSRARAARSGPRSIEPYSSSAARCVVVDRSDWCACCPWRSTTSAAASASDATVASRPST